MRKLVWGKKSCERNGFTLMELIIVVAIIGILSSVGIPGFKKMVAKSKQSEAKVALTRLYSAEAGFYAEFGAFTDALVRIGFEMNGRTLPSNYAGPEPTGLKIYSVGFSAFGDCHTMAKSPASPTNPLQRDPIVAVDPAFATDSHFIFYRSALINPGGSPQSKCLHGQISADGSTFRAAASAPLNGKDPNTVIPWSEIDQWTIDQDGLLVHVVDGIN